MDGIVHRRNSASVAVENTGRKVDMDNSNHVGWSQLDLHGPEQSDAAGKSASSLRVNLY